MNFRPVSGVASRIPRLRRWRSGWLWGTFLAVLFLGPGLSAQILNENTIKSRYLLGFVDFLRWDRENKSPLVVGLVEAESLRPALLALIADHRERGMRRGFEIVSVNSAEELEGLDVLFFGKGTGAHWAQFLPEAKLRGILTVGEEAGFLEAGGLIELFIRENRLRFTLDLNGAEDYRIGVSSKLASMAENVR
jgi:hypothetical protein